MAIKLMVQRLSGFVCQASLRAFEILCKVHMRKNPHVNLIDHYFIQLLSCIDRRIYAYAYCDREAQMRLSNSASSRRVCSMSPTLSGGVTDDFSMSVTLCDVWQTLCFEYDRFVDWMGAGSVDSSICVKCVLSCADADDYIQ